MTYLQQILEKYPEAPDWQQLYPWFSTGHLIAADRAKNSANFEIVAQQAAVFTNDIPRLHWLLHQPDWERTDLPDMPGEKEEQMILTATAASSSLTNEEPPLFHIDLSGPPDEEEPPAVEEENGGPVPAFSGSLAAAVSSFKENTSTDESLLFVTAYQHTIDYFASQGIKLEDEPAQDDQFGQQLKTFTSWLRQMKRLPQAPEQASDLQVESHAAHSLQKGDVLTESMVDVLVKQGKKQQAMQVLEKLRLLHPEKSLYFAARSEQIKHSKQ